jgi:predicted PurR-regulated permease PerM
MNRRIKNSETAEAAPTRLTRPQSNPVGGKHLWQIAAARDVVVLVLIAAGLWLIYELRQIFAPLLIALVLAHVFNPVVTSLDEKWRCPRPLTAALLLAIFVLGFVGLLAWLGPLLLAQVTDLARRLPEYLRTLAAAYEIDSGNLLNQLEQSLGQLQLEPQQILGQVYEATGRALGIVTTVFSVTSYLLLSVALILVYFFFFSWGFNSALHKLSRYLPESRKERVVEILSRMDTAIGQFFRGRLIIALIMGVFLSVGWYFTAVPYWFFLGMLTGLLNVVPYLSIVSWPLVILLKYAETLTSGQGHTADLGTIALWPSAVYVGVQILEGWLLTPWIQSGQTNLNAATILVVVIIGGALGGILGLLFAIPIAACVKIFFEEVILPRARRWAAGH